MYRLGRYDRLAILLYLASGLSGVMVAGPVAERIPYASMLLIVIGGIIYSLGVIFHVWESCASRTPSGTASSSSPPLSTILRCSPLSA